MTRPLVPEHAVLLGCWGVTQKIQDIRYLSTDIFIKAKEYYYLNTLPNKPVLSKNRRDKEKEVILEI